MDFRCASKKQDIVTLHYINLPSGSSSNEQTALRMGHAMKQRSGNILTLVGVVAQSLSLLDTIRSAPQITPIHCTIVLFLSYLS